MRPRLTVIVPCFNEEATLPLLHPRLGAVLDALDADARVLYVDDGSRDRTVELIEAIASQDPRVALLRLSRNFGKEIAMSAGLDHADADAVVLIDADLQDPPELIPELLAKHRIPADGARSKSWDEFARPDAPAVDFVFTVCDNAAGEVCPIWPGQPMTAHWGVADPAAVTASDEEKRRAFQRAFAELSARINLLLALPIEKLDRLVLKRKLDEIGKQ